MTSPTTRRCALVLLLVCAGSYAYFYQAGGWSQNSRFDLVRAVVEEGRLSIDSYRKNTLDLAVVAGHAYSDKAPGLALAAVPVGALPRPWTTSGGALGDIATVGFRRRWPASPRSPP